MHRDTDGLDDPSMHSHNHIEPGESCPDCGMHRKIIDAIPEKALTEDEVESLTESDTIHLAQPINLMKGSVMSGVADSSWGAEDIVIATDSAARLLSLEEKYGWVVKMEEPLSCDCCTPLEHGQNLLLDATEMLKNNIEEMMDDDELVNDPDLIRWPAEDEL